MLKSKLVAIAGILIMGTSATLAMDGAALYKAKGCGACHGDNANTPIMSAYPKIAGQNQEYVIRQLIDIKSGKRSNGQAAAMKGIMSAVNANEIKQLAQYLSRL